MSYKCLICNSDPYTLAENQAHINSESHVHKENLYKTDIRNNITFAKQFELVNKYKLSINLTIDELLDKIVECESCNKIETEEDKRIPMSLIHELTQFTKGKTEQTLNQVTERYLINNDNPDEHLIDIIITNNSLLETEQWKVRTKNQFKEYENIEVDILSSSKDSKYHHIDTYIRKIDSASCKKELPNILIMCYHKTRVVKDLITLFKIYSGKNFIINNTKLKFHINFDEPDANEGVTSEFLKEFYNNGGNEFRNIIRGIVFITATPYEDFWKMLGKHKILQLANINSKTELTEDEDISYKEYLECYRSIQDHKYIPLNDNTNNPLDYIKRIYDKKLIKGKGPFTIFAPAHIYTIAEDVGSHLEVLTYFKELGYYVYLSNGKFKGFISPKDEHISLEDFNLKYKPLKENWELRDSLRKWRSLNPKANLAITGYNTIERGVTFNTNDFNFTHAIISSYHAKKNNKLIQVIGRTTGNEKYVGEMTIICPQDVYDKVQILVENTIKLREENPENYNKSDFSDSKSGIPVKITFIDEAYREEIFILLLDKRKRLTIKESLHNKLVKGIEQGKIKLEDRNNINKFDINKRMLEQKRVYRKEKSLKGTGRRFKEFNVAFEHYTSASQTVNEREYAIDIAMHEYTHPDGDYINPINIAWITFRN